MVEINDLKPLIPIYPKRPLDRVEKDRDAQEKGTGQGSSKKQKDDDEDGSRIDEFA